MKTKYQVRFQDRGLLAKTSLHSQGLRVVVHSRTSGATWVAEVYDGIDDYRRDHMLADEGLDDPHLSLAMAGAEKTAKRLG